MTMIICLLLFGCDYQVQTKKNKQQEYELSVVDDDFQSFLLNDSGSSDPQPSASLIDVYYNYLTYENYSTYEVYVDYKKQTFIGIYLEQITIDKINEIYGDIPISPSLFVDSIDGLDGMFAKYREACWKKNIDVNQHHLYIYEFENRNIPLQNGNYQLVAVVTKNEIIFSELNGEQTYKSSLIRAASGSIDENFFQAKSNEFGQEKTNHYLNRNTVIRSYYYYSTIQVDFVSIFLYNNKECIYERVRALSDGEDRSSIYEEYYDFIKEAIIEENVYDDDYYRIDCCNIYDYEIIELLFLRKFH